MRQSFATPEPSIAKGSRVRYEFLATKQPLGSFAGMQQKIGAAYFAGTGVVTHVWGRSRRPKERPTVIALAIQPDNGGPEIEVPPSAVAGLP